MNPKYYVKAIAAGLGAAQLAFISAIMPDSELGSKVSLNELILLGLGTAIAAVGTYVVSNKPEA